MNMFSKEKSLFENIESVAKIIGICVACFGVWKYYDEVQIAKLEKANDFFEEFNSPSMVRLQDEIALLTYSWEKRLQKMVDKNSNGDLVERLDEMRKSDLLGEYRSTMNDFSSFFDKAMRCADVGRCDLATMTTLFNGDSKRFVAAMLPAILEVRRYDATYGNGMLCIHSTLDVSGELIFDCMD